MSLIVDRILYMNFGSTFSYLHPSHRTLPSPSPSTMSRQSTTGSSSSTTHLLARESTTSVAAAPHSPSAHDDDKRPLQPAKPKDFEAAFGALSSSYGYGGQVPTLPRKKAEASTSSAPKRPARLAWIRGSPRVRC